MTGYREFNPPCSRGAATPATGRALLLAFVFASLSGCDSLIGVADSPSRIVAEDLELPANASLMVTGTIADFECAFTRYIAAQGLVGDELMWASTSPWGREFDRREFSPSEGFYATQTCDQLWSPAVYKPLSTARWQADNALNLIDEWTDSEVPERTSLIATASAYSGYAHTLIGEGMCSAAFDLGPEIGPAEIMERALARFGRAIEAATSVGNQEILNMARVGRARVHLNLGDKAAAAADARLVPEGFARLATYDESPDRRANQVAFTNAAGGWSGVTIGEFYRDLSYEGVPDPRPQVTYSGRLGQDQVTPWWVQSKFDSRSDPMTIAKWEEAQLIIAEAEVQAGNLQAAVDIINMLHARAALPPFSSSDAAQVMDQIVYERRVELFLESQHLSDLNRYDLPLKPTPGEPYPGGGIYGNARCFPLPDVERVNNPNVP